MRLSDGPMGCWLGLAVAAVLLGLVAVWRFKTGVWKTQKV
jgi:Na+-driven multidrug efflux pump